MAGKGTSVSEVFGAVRRALTIGLDGGKRHIRCNRYRRHAEVHVFRHGVDLPARAVQPSLHCTAHCTRGRAKRVAGAGNGLVL